MSKVLVKILWVVGISVFMPFASAQTDGACYEAVQGKIAWDYKGNTRWNPAIVERLCGATPKSVEPAKCFENVLHGNVSWGGGTNWLWQNAISLCAGTPDADLSVECFTKQIQSKVPWRDAIKVCSAANIREQMVEKPAPKRPSQTFPSISTRPADRPVINPNLPSGVQRPSDSVAGSVRLHTPNLRSRAFEDLFQRKMSPQLERALIELEHNPYGGSGRIVGGLDCNDERRDAHPNASEVCDNIDNDCDGLVDEGQTLPYYLDADGDTHGDPNKRLNLCPAEITEAANQGKWLVRVGNDCDDTDPNVWNTCS